MSDLTADALDPIDQMIWERFKAERRPEVSVDGEDRWAYDPFAEEEL